MIKDIYGEEESTTPRSEIYKPLGGKILKFIGGGGGNKKLPYREREMSHQEIQKITNKYFEDLKEEYRVLGTYLLMYGGASGVPALVTYLTTGNTHFAADAATAGFWTLFLIDGLREMDIFEKLHKRLWKIKEE